MNLLNKFKKKSKTPTLKMKKNGAGFTLIEAIVVTAVIGIISSMMIVNWRKSENQYKLQRAAQEIAQSIRKAQDMALNGAVYGGSSPYNFGIHFSTSNRGSYIIYADTGLLGSPTYLRIQDIESILIERGVEIGYLYTRTYSSSGLSWRSRIYANFSIPDGFVEIRDNWLIISRYSAVIRIRRVGKTCPQYCRDIIIEKTGRIRIQ